MTRHDFITAADLAEEQSAINALREAPTREALAIAWQASCEHFRDASRDRLQAEFTRQLRRLGVLQP